VACTHLPPCCKVLEEGLQLPDRYRRPRCAAAGGGGGGAAPAGARFRLPCARPRLDERDQRPEVLAQLLLHKDGDAAAQELLERGQRLPPLGAMLLESGDEDAEEGGPANSRQNLLDFISGQRGCHTARCSFLRGLVSSCQPPLKLTEHRAR
jgi:hypothetical protein